MKSLPPSQSLDLLSRLTPGITSRRRIVILSALGGILGTLGSELLSSGAGLAQESSEDVSILNGALTLEHEAIWAYTAASGKLSNASLGKAVLAVAMVNLRDHQHHRDVLTQVIKSMGGSPVAAQESYDLSAYIEAGEGDLDSDANIAKLALALETDAALAYIRAFSQLSSADLIAEAATIAPNETAHATAIRAVFHDLDSTIPVIPAPFVSADTRSQWILKV